ncbi:glycoside hydrolase family 43 protein [Zasmidium cellare ATCC 36951]|uniref:Glycoside hydrolase family 43 protein n=1 Tax=Zasmidium cellare ATCC 36951 TaxID=1080233 RepID=A0A6A6C6Z5_ZASCE|nr:glycoside hydrolase family 43 protein [Zasmidium cellare ATCC 36951]KAF2162028.1 glycoside hydrolase family 43 protein [Zasmidium cellare ATCC 36951]
MRSLLLTSVVSLAGRFCFANGEKITFTSPRNPVLGDGSYYSADPGPIVDNNTLYIISGQDSAPPNDNDFIINDWFLFSSSDPKPAGAQWTLRTEFLKPHDVFGWAMTRGAYASQIIKGPDGRFYVYCPVMQANTTDEDPFGIGVAVADSIQGPYKDIHPSGPIVSQSHPAPGNNIENIDLTVYVDGDGKVYMYWGTFGSLKGVQLKSDMKTFASDVVDVTTLTGFFEAAWLTKRKDTYYMLYADNSAGPDSGCTPTVYHACIGYGTASSPLGPWTYQGVILGIVSSTTSHSGVVPYGDKWLFVYHTTDAVNGGNFRRSLAIDYMEFDDTKTPPRIKPITQTHRPASLPPPTYARQQFAKATSDPVCAIQYWIDSLHDLKTPVNPLPPEYWSSYNSADSQVKSIITYSWNTTIALNGTSMAFFADHDAGAVDGVAPPTQWWVEYKTSNGSWSRVQNLTSYLTAVSDTPVITYFKEVKTEGLRATLYAPTNGTSTAGIGIKEWAALSPQLSSW